MIAPLNVPPAFHKIFAYLVLMGIIYLLVLAELAAQQEQS